MNNLPEDQALKHAMDDDAKPEHLHQLAQHASPNVKEAVANHPNTAEHTLQHLHDNAATHPEPDSLKSTILAHSNAPAHLLNDAIKNHDDTQSHRTLRTMIDHPKAYPGVVNAKMHEMIGNIKDPEDVPYGVTDTASTWMKGDKSTKEDVAKYIDHPSKELASKAAESGKLDEGHISKFMNRKDVNASDLQDLVNDNKELSPELLQEMHDKHASPKTDDDNDYNANYSAGQLKSNILGHPNAPDKLLADEIEKKPDYDDGYHHKSHRREALKNPKTEAGMVDRLARSGDQNAVRASLEREDTDPSLIKHLWETHGKTVKKGSTYKDKSLKDDILRHPAFDDTLAGDAITKDTDTARALMKKGNVSEDTLKKIVNHKNQDVALEALKHKNVTPGVVAEAYKRKAADVSRAAADHPMATSAMKADKVDKDPEAAALIAKDADPEFAKTIFEKHGTNKNVANALLSNPNASPEILKGILKHSDDKKYGVDRWGDSNNKEVYSALSKHPNLDSDLRKQLLIKAPYEGSSHPNIQPDEMEEALNYHKNSTDSDSGRTTRHLAANFLNHPNLTPELAKKLVTSEFGTPSLNHHDQMDVNKRPEVFTPEVVKAGLDTPSELGSPETVNSLAQSKHLAPEEIKRYLNRPMSRGGEGESVDKARAKGLVNNQNAPSDVIKQIATGNHPHVQGVDYQEDAMKNPSFKDEDMKGYYQDFNAIDQSTEKLDSRHAQEHVQDLANAIKSRGLEDDALKTAHYEVVKNLVKRSTYSNDVDDKKLKTALDQHPVSAVKEDLIDSFGPKFRNSPDEKKAELFDQFASDPQSSLAKKAYPFMSKEGQKKVLQAADMTDPWIVKNLSNDSIKDVKINPDTKHEVVQAIANHPGATEDQIQDASNHSVVGAMGVLDRMHRGDSVKRKGSKGNDFLTPEETSSLHQQMLDKHQGPESHDMVRKILNNTRDPNTIKKIISRPDIANHLSAVADHSAVKTSDLDFLKQHKEPEFSHGMGKVAGNHKASTGLLAHIAQHYPEHLPEVASNPKASSPKLLKTLIDKGDLDTHVALAKNDKVPPEIRAHLMKNPKVLFAAKPDDATPEMLDELSKGDDLDIQNYVVKNRNATPEHRAASVMTALKSLKSGKPEDAAKAQNIIKEGMSRPLHESALEELGMQDENAAATAVKNQGATPGLASRLMDKYPNNPKLLDSLIDSDAANHPEVIHKILDQSDFKEPKESKVQSNQSGIHYKKDEEENFYAPARIHNLLKAADGENLKDGHIEKFYNKLKEARPDGYDYKNDHIRSSDKHSMEWMARKVANPEIQKNMLQEPGFASHLSENPKLTKPHYDDLINKYTGNDENFKKASGGLDSDVITNLVNHPSASPAATDKLYDHVKDTSKDDYENIKPFATSKKISPETAASIATNFKGVPEVLSNPKLPESSIREAINGQFGAGSKKGPIPGYIQGDLSNYIASNPKFKLSMLDQVPKEAMEEDSRNGNMRKEALYHTLLKNRFADSKDLNDVYNYFEKAQNGGINAARRALISHPNAPEELLDKWVKDGKVFKEDLYHSPVVGGKTWRAEKHEFPQGLNLEPGKENNVATFRPSEDKVKQVMSMIPEGDKLNWANFKKENPSLAGNPVIQKLFTSAPKQMVDKQHAQEYLEKNMPKKNFHVSYAPWNGMQRHNNKNQVVFQLNNGEDQDAVYKDKSNPDMNGLYRMIQDASTRSGHPVNPQSIGWSRVDTSNPDHWFIDEVQSDYGSGLSKELDEMQKRGRSDELEKRGVEPENVKPTLNKLVDTIGGWDRGLVNNIIETAKKHGVKKISMHSGASKTLANKGRSEEVTNKYDKLYNKMPAEMGFQEDRYDNLPSRNDKSDLMGQPIWTLDMNPEETQALKDKRKAKLAGKMTMKKPEGEGGPEGESE